MLVQKHIFDNEKTPKTKKKIVILYKKKFTELYGYKICEPNGFHKDGKVNQRTLMYNFFFKITNLVIHIQIQGTDILRQRSPPPVCHMSHVYVTCHMSGVKCHFCDKPDVVFEHKIKLKTDKYIYKTEKNMKK